MDLRAGLEGLAAPAARLRTEVAARAEVVPAARLLMELAARAVVREAMAALAARLRTDWVGREDRVTTALPAALPMTDRQGLAGQEAHPRTTAVWGRLCTNRRGSRNARIPDAPGLT